jgi:2-dehydro-3-deoxyphosphooctonate aldolase (KDO 8-P synthase)
VGIDALFLEVHPDPDHAPSDGPNMVRLDRLAELLSEVARIAGAAVPAPNPVDATL